jgi:hypothetical protein
LSVRHTRKQSRSCNPSPSAATSSAGSPSRGCPPQKDLTYHIYPATSAPMCHAIRQPNLTRKTRSDNDNRVAMAYAHFTPPSLALARTPCPRATKNAPSDHRKRYICHQQKCLTRVAAGLPRRCRRWVFFRDAPLHNICATAPSHAQRTTSMRVALLLLLPHAHPSIMESTSKDTGISLVLVKERAGRQSQQPV